ncbi:MAG: hypothetical protein WD696_04790 [Bryobacteraceae bacterium]
MTSARVALVVAGAGLALAGLLASRQVLLLSQVAAQSTVPVDPSQLTLRVRFGAEDQSERPWDGSVSVSGGEIAALRNWHPRPGDAIDGKTAWKLATRKGPNFNRRPWEEEPNTAPVPYLLVPGVVVDAKVSAGTRFAFTTRQGSFEVSAAELTPGAVLRRLNGSVLVDRVPSAQLLSVAEYQNDSPAMLSGSNGEVWMAWVAYRNKANEVFARRMDGQRWLPPQRVTEKPGDIFLVKMGRDRNGHAWAVWSAQAEGNWDLYARRFDGNAWSRTERLTEDAQPDVYHNLARDSNGNLWLVWQGFRSGKSDIFARRHNGSSWSPAERVSTSPANDWEPAIAADAQGRVYVAWDTYDKGNYDIAMRRSENGQWGDVVSVAGTQKYEAHVSLVCDRQNRLWAAWNESGMQWGKDSGFLVKKEATRLYQSRWMNVAVYSNGTWEEPTAEINQSLPEELKEYNDFPVLETDAAGRVWVFFRNRTNRIRDVHSNAPAHRAAWEIWGTAYEGAKWTTPMHMPFSQNRTDVRGGTAHDGKGTVYAAWATDNRNFEDFLFKHSDVYAAPLPSLPGSAAKPRLKQRAIPELKTFTVHSDEPGDLRRIRGYRIESGGKTYGIYRGDTHRHTEFSMDGNNDGTLVQTYRYAIDAAELDYLAVSEHNGAGGPDEEYINWLLQQHCDLWKTSNRFLPLYGYERSLPYPNGHRNILFATRGNPTLPIPPEEMKGKTGAQALYEYLKKYKGIAISHTSATSMGTDWRDNDPEVEPLVEIYQGDRVSAEYEGAPKAAHRGNLGSAPGGFRPAGYVWNAWAKGYKLGVQVSSDHLSTHISYACTIATDFTREGLLDAMRKRHSYGATDNIILDYRMQAGGKEYLQGDILEHSGDFQLSVKVIGTAPIRQIDVVKDNQFLHTRQPLEKEVSFTYVDNQPKQSGESYYYVRVIQVDDQMAWSSPIWIKRN